MNERKQTKVTNKYEKIIIERMKQYWINNKWVSKRMKMIKTKRQQKKKERKKFRKIKWLTYWKKKKKKQTNAGE